jgi:invasion protein IalB
VAVVLLCAAVFALTRYLYRDASGVQPQTDLATDQQLVPVQFPEVAWSTYSKHESWVVRCPKEANAAALKTTCVGELAAFDGQHRRLFLMIIGHSRNGPLVLNLELPTGVTISPGVRLQFDKTQSRRLRFVMCGDKSCLTGVQLDPAFVAAGRAAKFAAITISPTSRRPLTFRIPISGFDATVSDLQ